MKTFPSTLLDQMRQIGDPVAASAVLSMYRSKSTQQIREYLRQDLRNSAPLPDFFPPKLKAYFEETALLPSWADERLLRKGVRFFKQYAGQIMGMLGSYSLPYCYAAADGAKVLHLSQRMQSNTFQRLAETGKFVFDIMDDEAFTPYGFGLRSIQKVRLIHEVIRYHVKKHQSWDMAYGLPVNQEDMAGTNLAFSLVVLRGLRRTGHLIAPDESEAYLHYWKVVGYLLGLEEALLPDNGKEASQLATIVEARNFRPSEEGKMLTQALLESFNEVLPPNLPQGYIYSYMRFLLGEEMAELLGIPPANWTKTLISQMRWVNALGEIVGGVGLGGPSSLSEVKQRSMGGMLSPQLGLPNGI